MRKLSQGEPVKIAADDYNRWQEAGRAHAMSRLNQSQQIVTPDSQEGIVLVKNTLSRAMPRFSVLGLRGSTYNPLYSDQQLTEFKNQIALHGETPSSVTSGRFCVLQNDAQPGEVVAGMVSGVTPCRIKVESLTDEFAEIETTTTVDQTRYIKSGSTGSAQILFRPEYLGEQWGVVRLGNRAVPADEIIVRNNSGEVVPAYAVMRVTGVTIEDEIEVHTVEKPSSTFKTRYIVNSSDSIPIGEDGTGTWLKNSGPVLYNNSAGTPAVDEEWGAKNGQWSLEKYRPGFIISGGNENNGTLYWTRAKQRIVTDLLAKNDDSTISASATGTFSIWMGQSGSEAATEYDITARVFIAYAAANKWSSIGFRNGNWYAVPLVC